MTPCSCSTQNLISENVNHILFCLKHLEGSFPYFRAVTQHLDRVFEVLTLGYCLPLSPFLMFSYALAKWSSVQSFDFLSLSFTHVGVFIQLLLFGLPSQLLNLTPFSRLKSFSPGSLPLPSQTGSCTQTPQSEFPCIFPPVLNAPHCSCLPMWIPHKSPVVLMSVTLFSDVHSVTSGTTKLWSIF